MPENNLISSIKRVIRLERLERVNKLLDEGWVILETEKNRPEDSDIVFYHLGHANPNADTHDEEFSEWNPRG